MVSFEPPLVTDISPQPTASPLAHLQAGTTKMVTNLHHRPVQLSDFDRLVIRQLDGNHDHAAIVNRLMAAVLDGSFPLQRDGLPLTDTIEIRQILERSLPPSLQRMRSSVLLVG